MLPAEPSSPGECRGLVPRSLQGNLISVHIRLTAASSSLAVAVCFPCYMQRSRTYHFFVMELTYCLMRMACVSRFMGTLRAIITTIIDEQRRNDNNLIIQSNRTRHTNVLPMIFKCLALYKQREICCTEAPLPTPHPPSKFSDSRIRTSS